MPVFILRSSPPVSTACSIGVSAPSSRMSAYAKGFPTGCFSRGCATHAQLTTLPAVPTSTSSESVSLVSGSYSFGGTSTLPFLRRTPRMRPSFRPPKKRPSTGPVERL